jgi:hypothetical protein
MTNPESIYRIVFIATCVFLVTEAIFSTLDVMKSKNSTTLSQATSWIRSIFMIVLATVIFLLLGSTVTSAVSTSY